MTAAQFGAFGICRGFHDDVVLLGEVFLSIFIECDASETSVQSGGGFQ
jgi:hypothetical protein